MPLSMPIAPTRMMLPAALFNLATGAPNFAVGTTVQMGYWALDPSTQESVWGPLDFPDDWQTFNTFLWTMTLGTTATGNCRMQVVVNNVIDAQTSNLSAGAPVTVAIIGGTTNRISRSALDVGLSRPALSTLVNVGCVRIAADAADTYAADIGLVGIELVKAS